MRLLARHDRKARGPSTKFKPGSRHRARTFEEAIVALDKALDAFARKTGIARPHERKQDEDGKD